MTTAQTASAPPAAAAPPAAREPARGDGWGWLDTAGLAAALVLAVIAVDTWTDGRLVSRRLFPARRPPREPGEGEPGARD